MSFNSLQLFISGALIFLFVTMIYIYTKNIKAQQKNNIFKNTVKYDADFIAYKLYNRRDRQIEYYKFLREEIKREDEITHQRLMWGITFQGFLISAVAAILVFSWKDSTIGIFYMRKVTILAIGFVGLIVSFFVYYGVLASRNSIRDVVRKWNTMNSKWKLYPYEVPQAFGQEVEFNSGTMYAERVPFFFALMWFLFIISYISVIYYFEIIPCKQSYHILNDILNCVYEMQPQEPSMQTPVLSGGQ